MAHQWYCSIDGEERGPLVSREIRELAAKGSLRPNDLIWREGLPDWVRADSVEGLFPKQQQPGPPPIPRQNVTRPPQEPIGLDPQADSTSDRSPPDPTEVFESVKHLTVTKFGELKHAAKQMLDRVLHPQTFETTPETNPKSASREPDTKTPQLTSSQKKTWDDWMWRISSAHTMLRRNRFITS